LSFLSSHTNVVSVSRCIVGCSGSHLRSSNDEWLVSRSGRWIIPRHWRVWRETGRLRRLFASFWNVAAPDSVRPVLSS